MTEETFSAYRMRRAAEAAAKDQAPPAAVLPAASHSPRAAGGAPSKDIYGLVATFRELGLPDLIPEYRFHPLRKWRADYAAPLAMILIEIDGGAWSQGRHTRGAGFIADQQKRNAAILLGWRPLSYTPDRLDECYRDVRMLVAK